MSYTYNVDMSTVEGLDGFFAFMGAYSLIILAVCIYSIIVSWKIFVKAGEAGWKCLIPYYSTYILFKIVFGSGWKMFWLIVPFANIYWLIKLYLNLAKAFGKDTGFGVGLIFLSIIFMSILAFGDAEYQGSVA